MKRVITIESLERLTNSTNGNPRWRVHLVGGGHVDTAADAQIGHTIGNREFQGCEVEIELDGRGKVTRAEPRGGRGGGTA